MIISASSVLYLDGAKRQFSAHRNYPFHWAIRQAPSFILSIRYDASSKAKLVFA
ncbi:MAG: hypothetical protein LBT46_11775 [Planctomycetaceae bacterium]|nr:hypothetical protein [Planctomycetaceae bacterium]